MGNCRELLAASRGLPPPLAPAGETTSPNVASLLEEEIWRGPPSHGFAVAREEPTGPE